MDGVKDFLGCLFYDSGVVFQRTPYNIPNSFLTFSGDILWLWYIPELTEHTARFGSM